jgi:hypothetical protein
LFQRSYSYCSLVHTLCRGYERQVVLQGKHEIDAFMGLDTWTRAHTLRCQSSTALAPIHSGSYARAWKDIGKIRIILESVNFGPISTSNLPLILAQEISKMPSHMPRRWVVGRSCGTRHGGMHRPSLESFVTSYARCARMWCPHDSVCVLQRLVAAWRHSRMKGSPKCHTL